MARTCSESVAGHGRRSWVGHGIGHTKSGRLLTVLYSERRGRVRVVTAYETTKGRQEMYFEEK